MKQLEKLQIEVAILRKLIVKYFDKEELSDSEVRNLERCIEDLRSKEQQIEALENRND